ncbi:MAG: Fe2+-dependent dioxygenase [Gammaproteobacteria bacterium RIFOXYA12_FULL_61_12]|nr:MAG: Fe2+-dependent dioxygenase [Gammaproteobacteria bacterium RIFOXYA12_FULL_61_12]OGT88570.1 MAG: Fe2+-dependent dioxygenase [Gammaproteobacteria bacterium RIFOXYD12_FULL_61_37]
MLLEFPGILNEAQREKISQLLEKADFADGRRTAGMAAERVKANEEMEATSDQQRLLNRVIMSAVAQNPRFRSFALPNKMADFIVARYKPGMTYGDHVDDPIMGAGGPRFRTDVSMTIFLSEPESYDGGELTVRTPFGLKQVKLNAGDAVVYPSASVHQVAPVTRGERLVALTWMQSFVRDAAKRELLFELDQTREHLLRTDPDAETTKYLDRSYANLLRMWAET